MRRYFVKNCLLCYVFLKQQTDFVPRKAFLVYSSSLIVYESRSSSTIGVLISKPSYLYQPYLEIFEKIRIIFIINTLLYQWSSSYILVFEEYFLSKFTFAKFHILRWLTLEYVSRLKWFIFSFFLDAKFCYNYI